MKKSFVSSVSFFMLILFFKPVFGQEAGISFGTSVFPAIALEQSYSYIDLVPSYPVSRSTIAASKELMVHFSYYLNSNIRLNLAAGYGFSNTKKDWKTVFSGGGTDLVSVSSEELSTEGYPGFIELQFLAPLNESGTLIPFIGLGAGYCSYKTKLTDKSNSSTSKTDLNTKGFGQYVSAGLTIKFTQRASVFFQLEKLLLSSLKTEKSNPVRFPSNETYPIETSSFEQLIQPGFGDVALLAGVRFYMGK